MYCKAGQSTEEQMYNNGMLSLFYLNGLFNVSFLRARVLTIDISKAKR